MKPYSTIMAGACAIILSGCQTTTYEKIGYGPDVEYSKARCEIGAMSTEQGFIAMGSAGYVLGASLGNAIGNEIRKQEFIKRCMVLHGWRAVPGHSQQTRPAASAQSQPVAQPQAAPATLPRNRYTPSTPKHLGSPPMGPVRAAM